MKLKTLGGFMLENLLEKYSKFMSPMFVYQLQDINAQVVDIETLEKFYACEFVIHKVLCDGVILLKDFKPTQNVNSFYDEFRDENLMVVCFEDEQFGIKVQPLSMLDFYERLETY